MATFDKIQDSFIWEPRFCFLGCQISWDPNFCLLGSKLVVEEEDEEARVNNHEWSADVLDLELDL